MREEKCVRLLYYSAYIFVVTEKSGEKEVNTMRKSKLKIASCFVALISLCVVIFAACGGNGNETTPQIPTYTIQYTDNTGVHSIEVQSGKVYSIRSIPEKNGYEFMGLYDAEVG